MLKLTDKNVNIKIYEDYLLYLLNKYFNINNNIINNNPFLHFSCFYPLPNSLEITYYKQDDEITNNNNIYEFIGNSSINRILFGNRLLPNTSTDPIPFTFPIKISDNIIELFNTNCFYYEVTIDEQTKESWENESISVGYGSITTPLRCNPGWFNESIGYNLIDGSIQFNQIINKNSGPICNIGDTIGAGILYIDINTFKFFFTFNGKIIHNEYLKNNNIIIKSHITTIIGYNHSCKIKVNFGNDIFKFNIKEFCNTNFIISQNNNFINNHNFINIIDTNKIIQNKIKNKDLSTAINFTELNIQNTILSPLFSFTNNNNNNEFDNLILTIFTQNNL